MMNWDYLLLSSLSGIIVGLIVSFYKFKLSKDDETLVGLTDLKMKNISDKVDMIYHHLEKIEELVKDLSSLDKKVEVLSVQYGQMAKQIQSLTRAFE